MDNSANTAQDKSSALGLSAAAGNAARGASVDSLDDEKWTYEQMTAEERQRVALQKTTAEQAQAALRSAQVASASNGLNIQKMIANTGETGEKNSSSSS